MPAVLIFSSVGVGVRSDCTTDLSAVCSAIDAEDCEEPWLAEKCCATCANPGGQSCSRDSWTSLTQSMREHEVFIFNLPSACRSGDKSVPRPLAAPYALRMGQPITLLHDLGFVVNGSVDGSQGGSGGFGVISWPSAPGYFYAGGLDVNLTPSGFGMGRLRDGWMHAGKFVGGVCGGICVETETLADGDHATLTHPDSTPDWTSDEIFRHIQKVSDMARDAAAMGRMAAEAAQLALFFASCPLQQT